VTSTHTQSNSFLTITFDCRLPEFCSTTLSVLTQFLTTHSSIWYVSSSSDWTLHTNYSDFQMNCQSNQSQSYVTIDNQSASPSGAEDQICITVRQLQVCWCWELYLTRGWVYRWIVSSSQSQSHIATDGQSVLVLSPIWSSRPDMYYCLTVTVLLLWGALSDERTGLSFVRVIVCSSK
jgi:hypothetical protein